MGDGRKEGKSMGGEGEAERPHLNQLSPGAVFKLQTHTLIPCLQTSNPYVGVLRCHPRPPPPPPSPPKGRVGLSEGRLLKQNMNRERRGISTQKDRE
jgi:hypothetical protein